jgi:hypothetical protein
VQRRKSLQEKCQKQLNLLIGHTLWACGRASDLQWFHFGTPRMVKDYKGGFKEVGEYALHIQCHWRICLKDKVIVASRDRFYPKDKNANLSLDFDWDKPGVNLCDAGVDCFINKECPIVPQSIIVDEVGGFKVILEHGYCLDAFPDLSGDQEHWRLFHPGEDTPHVVLEGNKLNGSLRKI